MKIDYDIIDKISEKYNNLFFVIVGAMDGLKHDNLVPYLTKNKLDGLFIEPMPDIFKSLKDNYKNYEGKVLFENCAISNLNGEVSMFTVPVDKIGTTYPEWTDGCSTLYPERGPIKNFELNEVKVVSSDLKSVLSKHKIQQYDIIQIDAEGADYEIFDSIDLVVDKPKFIAIEIMHLSKEEVDNIKNKLKTNGYRFEILVDLLAVEEECYKKICQYEDIS